MFGGKAAYPSYPLSGQYGKRNRTRYGSRGESLPRMVEAAGIEPASEKDRTSVSTRLADSFFYLTIRLLNGKPADSQPVKSRGSVTGVPVPPAQINVALQIALGELPVRRHGQLSRECVVVIGDYYFPPD